MRRWSLIAAGLAVIVLTMTTAAGHYLQSGWRWTYKSGDDCTKNLVQVSHASNAPGGRFVGAVERWDELWTPFQTANCGQDGDAPERVWVRTWWFKASTNQWTICRDPGWVNGPWGFRFTVTYNWNAPPCTAGYYTADSAGQQQNGDWHGGWIRLADTSATWYHWYPA